MGDMLELVNNWFDLLNTQSKYGRHSGLCSYGVYLECQDDILDRMSEFVFKIRVCEKKSFMPFQRGILLVNNSLKELLLYVKEKYKCENFVPEYINRQLYQDILENFFAHIRSMGGLHDNPSSVECQTLKRYIVKTFRVRNIRKEKHRNRYELNSNRGFERCTRFFPIRIDELFWTGWSRDGNINV